MEAALALIALAAALLARTWRLLASRQPLAHEAQGAPATLWTPLLATLVLLPWAWALPTLHHMPLQLQWSGACLVLLTLGWPLAVPVICLIAALSGLVAPAPVEALIANAFWIGVLPATIALWLGALLRRYIGPHVFVYTLGRGFIVTAVSTFGASLLGEWAGADLPNIEPGLVTTAHWMMAWGEAFMTGMFSAIFVAFRPQWLATWSDNLYLHK